MNNEASDWIRENYEMLIHEYNNQWVGASSNGERIVSGSTFDAALQELEGDEISISEIVFIYLTQESIQ